MGEKISDLINQVLSEAGKQGIGIGIEEIEDER
jgi:hypothetical protein